MPSKVPQTPWKWLPIGQGIWGSFSHPSDMLWRPFRGHFLQILLPKGVFRSLFLCIYCFYKLSKPLPVANEWQPQREGVLTICKSRKYIEKGFWKPLLVAKLAENDPQMASKACLKDGKWTPRLAFPFVITFHGLWGTFLGKPSWNDPKTLKPYFSVWPNAPKRGFDDLLLICLWIEMHKFLMHWHFDR